MALSARCWAGTPVGSPGLRSWPLKACPWPSSSCSAGGPPRPSSGTRSRRRRRPRTPWRARRQEGQGAGHSWLSRSPWPTPRPMQVSHRLGFPGSSSSRRFARSGRSPKQTGGRSILYISPGRGAYTSPTRTRPTRTGRLGAQWAAAGRTAGVSSFGCLLRPPARPFAVVASRRGWKAAARLWRVLRARPPGPRGPLLRLTGPRLPPSLEARRPTHDARSPRKGFG